MSPAQLRANRTSADDIFKPGATTNPAAAASTRFARFSKTSGHRAFRLGGRPWCPASQLVLNILATMPSRGHANFAKIAGDAWTRSTLISTPRRSPSLDSPSQSCEPLRAAWARDRDSAGPRARGARTRRRLAVKQHLWQEIVLATGCAGDLSTTPRHRAINKPLTSSRRPGPPVLSSGLAGAGQFTPMCSPSCFRIGFRKSRETVRIKFRTSWQYPWASPWRFSNPSLSSRFYRLRARRTPARHMDGERDRARQLRPRRCD